MSRIQSVWSLVLLVLLRSVLGKQPCDLKDEECLLKVAKDTFKSLVIMNPVDPLHVDQITGHTDHFTYEVTNSSLSGLKKCDVLLMKYDLEKTTYETHFHCPELIFDYYFGVQGTLDTIILNGKGAGAITIDDYILKFKGSYSISDSEKDQKSRITIKNNNLDSDLKGKAKFESKYLTFGNKDTYDKITQYFNTNYKVNEILFRTHILEKYVKVLEKEVNTYLSKISLDELISSDKED